MGNTKELHEDLQDALIMLEFKVGHLHKYGKITEDDIDKLCDVMDEMSTHWRKVNQELRNTNNKEQ